MTEPLDLGRDVLIVDGRDAAAAVRQDPRRLRKIIVPHARPEFGEVLLPAEGRVGRWPGGSRGARPVVESQSLQLSWADGGAAQKPHWHNRQIESYSSPGEIALAYCPVDGATAGFQAARFTGRVFIPPRVCHLVRLSGLTEVIQFRVGGAEGEDLAQDQTICAGCHRSDVCSSDLARAALDELP